MSIEWRPCGLLSGNPVRPYAVLILNQPINIRALNAVIGAASMLVCADAGADRFYKYEKLATSGLKKRLPDAVIGDLDSLSKEIEEYYREKGVEIVKDPDQYSTDFTKCLKWIRQAAIRMENNPESILDVVVLGGLGGRVDQGFSQIHHLYMARNNHELVNGHIYLLSEQSLSFILEDGINVICLEEGYFEENVGIIPVLGPCQITTKGLEWDVKDWPTQFGGQISTSNHIRSNRLELSFDSNRPLFTLELAKRLTTLSSDQT